MRIRSMVSALTAAFPPIFGTRSGGAVGVAYNQTLQATSTSRSN